MESGPSPRGRGNHRAGARWRIGRRSIPAWAGKPSRCSPATTPLGVHPRVGGETRAAAIATMSNAGPSPRGRGNPADAGAGQREARSIPAWAGKPSAISPITAPAWVHPRVGGETLLKAFGCALVGGPSPRGRGNPARRLPGRPGCRSIPAWAGKPPAGPRGGRGLPVHPRVGGETRRDSMKRPSDVGPSPRGRGNRIQRPADLCYGGSIPAWAGKPGSAVPAGPLSRVHPRVGGETSARTSSLSVMPGPSPRGRGNPCRLRVVPLGVGSIPAWAGKPDGAQPDAGIGRVHPRVGGETDKPRVLASLAGGPSPRGRGNLCVILTQS